MGAPKKYTDEEMRKRRREQARRWEAKNPDKMAEKNVKDCERKKKRRHEAKQKRLEEKARLASIKTCSICGETKQKELFKKRGIGYTDKCLVCSPNITEKEKNARKAIRNKERRRAAGIPPRKISERATEYDALKLKVEGPKDKSPFRKRHLDWVVIVGDIYGGGMVVKHRDGILMFLRQDGFCRYGVLGDDSGFTSIRLEKAEALRDRIWKMVG